MPHDPYKALYLHLPYCVKKCAYCDFISFAVKPDSCEIDEYIEQMVLDIRRKAREGELAQIETVYLGGGTPSFVGQKRLSSLLYALSVSMRLEPDIECTMEANPESLTEELVRDVWALGVNRLSLGVQSFDDEVLQTLGRAHDTATALRAVGAAKTRFDNISIDLMCGIPGQSEQSFRETLEQAIEFDLSHISIYPLTIERGTAFARMVHLGELSEPDEDVQAAQMELAADLLTSAGFARYEVASYAKPGYECRHNKTYWSGLPYLGLGTSAATMTQNEQRRMRVRDGEVLDDLNPVQMRAEDLMLSMRMSRGVSIEAVKEAASDLLPQAQETFDNLVDLDLVVLEDGRYKPTKQGWLCGNELYGRIFALA